MSSCVVIADAANVAHLGVLILVFVLACRGVCCFLSGEARHVLCTSVLWRTRSTTWFAHTLDLCIIVLRVTHEQGRGLAVQGVVRVRVPEELGKEHLEDVDHVCGVGRVQGE